MKNWLTIISSVTFVINAFKMKDVNTILSFSLSYLSTIGLNFYSLTPKKGPAKNRRVKLINFAIASFALSIIATIIVANDFGVFVDSCVLYLIRILYFLFAVFAIICTIKDDSVIMTPEEIDAHTSTKENLKKNKEKQKFKARDENAKNNKKKRKFLDSKKKNSEED